MPFAPDPYATLRIAARHVRQFRGKIFVVKLGGELLDDPATTRSIAEQLALLWSFSIPLVVVHGGGTRLDRLCDTLDLDIVKAAGRRVTSPEVLEAAKMAIRGDVQMTLVAALESAGIPAVGLSGLDGGLIRATRRPPVEVDGAEVDFGLVGDIEQVNPALVTNLLAGGFVPVVAPFTADRSGQVYNTNADTVAAALAVALGAQKLLFLVRVPGLLRDASDPSSLVPLADAATLDSLAASGAIQGGMRPKIAAARQALDAGVASVHLVSGLGPDNLLIEVFTNEGSGTMLVGEAPLGAGA